MNGRHPEPRDHRRQVETAAIVAACAAALLSLAVVAVQVEHAQTPAPHGEREAASFQPLPTLRPAPAHHVTG